MRTLIQSWIKKLVECTECIAALVFLAALVPILLIAAWLFAARG